MRSPCFRRLTFLAKQNRTSCDALQGILKLAKDQEVDCIHPGYGFLSENAQFARRCGEEGIVFIGPKPETIEARPWGSRCSCQTTGCSMSRCDVEANDCMWWCSACADSWMWLDVQGLPLRVASGAWCQSRRIIPPSW